MIYLAINFYKKYRLILLNVLYTGISQLASLVSLFYINRILVERVGIEIFGTLIHDVATLVPTLGVKKPIKVINEN